MSADKGGPAFPTATLAQKTEGGMTLRDYFAAKAMQGILPLCKTNAFAAQECYAIADAMLKAREV
jgi:hypothetical protein